MNFKIPCKASEERKTIPDYISQDLEYLEKSYQINGKLDETIFSFFGKQPNCYGYALDLMSHTKDFQKGKSWSLSRAVMEAFAKWCRKNDISWQLTRHLQTRALFTVLKQSNGSLVGFVCKIYKLKEETELVKQHIEKLIDDRKYREVYYTITSLNLQREFSLSKVVLPLFFLEKESWLKNYLENFPELQLQLIKTLDSVSASRQNILDLIRSLNIDDVKKHVYDTSWILKRIAHFVDVFNIDLNECPNLLFSRSSGALHYLIRKRYMEETITDEPWEELITCIVNENPSLQKELVTRVTCLNDCEMALRLALKFNINKNEWPSTLHSFYDTSVNKPQDVLPRVWDEDQKSSSYLSLQRIDMSDIHFVDDEKNFMSAIEDISDNYDVVGIDAEWRPNLGIRKERIALLQLAVWDSVYLLDILALKDCLKQHSWDFMMNTVFYNPKMLKLGYGIFNDLRLLMNVFEEDKSSKLSSVIDAGDFFKKLKYMHPSVMKNFDDTEENNTTNEDHRGLSQLCATILGKPLNKDEQFSDWERRPLRKKQIVYAALDAFCLLLVYEKLYHILKEMGLNFEDIDKKSISKMVNKKKEKEKKKVPEIVRSPSKITDFRVVVDNMLHGLGKYLRVCGADVVIIKNEEDHMDAIKIAQSESRVILTNGGPYAKLKGYMPDDMCFFVPESLIVQEQAACVLKHFNVHLSEAAIFSRCAVCNGNHYLKVPSEDLRILWSNQPAYPKDVIQTQAIEFDMKPYFSYEDGFITQKGILHTGVPIQLHYLSQQVFKRIQIFFVCSTCGKVYWEGSHFGRVRENIANYLPIQKDIESGEENVYLGMSKARFKDLPNTPALKPNSSSECVSTDFNLQKQEPETSKTNSTFGCVLSSALGQNSSKTLSADNDSTDVREAKRLTMQFDVGSDHNSSDYDSDDLVYFD